MNIPFWTSAGTINLADLQEQDLTAEILADTLAKLNRFGGRTREPWSVAAHSVLVERLCPPDLGAWALLHDAHEAIVGDIATPAVDLIALMGNLPQFDDALAKAKGQIDLVIARHWSLSVRSLNQTLCRADRIALIAEAVWFLDAPAERFEPRDDEDIDRALCLLSEMLPASDWRAARELWLSRVEHYAGLGQMTPPATTNPADTVSGG